MFFCLLLLPVLLLSTNVFSMVKITALPETERIRLQELTLDDTPALHTILGDPEVMGHAAPVMPLDEVKNFLQTRIIPSYKEHGWGRYGLVNKNTGALMGFGGLCVHSRLDIEGVQENYKPIALSIVLAKAYWQQGYATELMKLVLEQAHTSLQLSEVIAVIEPKNNKSVGLAQKAGFSFWKHAKLRDEAVDVYKLALK